MTLLEKALAAKTTRIPDGPLGAEELDVLVAWLQGKISSGIASETIFHTGNNAESKLAAAVRRAIRHNQFTITRN